MSDKVDLLATAKAEEAELDRQLQASPTYRRLALVRQFITAYSATATGTREAAPQRVNGHARSKGGGNKIKATADAAEKIVRQHGEPMQRGPLFEALQAAGCVIKGKDPRNTLASRLIHSKRFVVVEGKGYCPLDMAQ